jgi:uncharacterized membrane protein
MNRPKIHITKAPLDRILDKAAFALVVLTLCLAAIYYGRLPDTIPVHFNTTGDPDRFGHKTTLLVIPAISLFLFIGLRYLSNFPESFNYPVKITVENAETQYQMGLRILYVLNLTFTGIFAYMTFATIQTALGKWNGLGKGLFWFIIIGIAALIWQTFRQAKAG